MNERRRIEILEEIAKDWLESWPGLMNPGDEAIPTVGSKLRLDKPRVVRLTFAESSAAVDYGPVTSIEIVR